MRHLPPGNQVPLKRLSDGAKTDKTSHPPSRRPKVVSISAGNHRSRVLEKRDRLVEQNLGLVYKIAREIHQNLPPCFELDDLISTGFVALLNAAVLYRPRLYGNAPFSSFAWP